MIFEVLMMTSLAAQGKKNFKYLQFQGHKTLKPRSKFILKNLFFVQFKTKWSKISVEFPFNINVF